jgi:serine/threonine protein kinase
VLFSKRHDCWKLTDFGSASQATSKRLNTTQFTRGTESYRAPEVLQLARFNNRTDIFAIGCIIFEMLTAQKLFPNDWAVLQYVQSDTSILTSRWPPYLPETRLHWLGAITSSLLARDPISRPAAIRTKRMLQAIRTGVNPFDQLQDLTFEDDGFIEEESNFISPRPVLQSAFRKQPVSGLTINSSSAGDGIKDVHKDRRVYVGNLGSEVKWPALKDYMHSGKHNTFKPFLHLLFCFVFFSGGLRIVTHLKPETYCMQRF